MAEYAADPDATRWRFGRLIDDVLREHSGRNVFQTWEIDILLDLRQCTAKGSRRRSLLERYKRAASKAIDRGEWPPPTLSQYIERSSRTQNRDQPAG